MAFFVSAIHNSLFAIHTNSENQDFRCPITDVAFLGGSKNMVSGTKWVTMGRHGLILWENGATGSRIIIK